MAAQDALTEEELEKLLEQVNTRYPTGQRNLALLTLMADTGLRLAETLGLETGHLEREGRVVTHVRVTGKGGKEATVVVSTRAAARLDAWLSTRADLGIGNGHVFCTVSRGRRQGFGGEHELTPGRAVNPRYVRQLVGRLAERAGIERRVTPHTLRHTFGTHLLRKTGNLELTRKALRHARVSTTAEVYAHLADRDVEDAVRDLHGDGSAEADADGQTEAEKVAAQVLAALPAEVAEALAKLAGGQEVNGA